MAVAKLILKELVMPVETWLPAVFVLGMALLGLCGLFLKACQHI
jgi:hypothetical protein